MGSELATFLRYAVPIATLLTVIIYAYKQGKSTGRIEEKLDTICDDMQKSVAERLRCQDAREKNEGELYAKANENAKAIEYLKGLKNGQKEGHI